MTTRADHIASLPATSTAIVTGAPDKQTVIQDLMVANRGMVIEPTKTAATGYLPYIGTQVWEGHTTSLFNQSQPQLLQLSDTLTIVYVYDQLTEPYRYYVQALELDEAKKVARSGPPNIIEITASSSGDWATERFLVKLSGTKFVAYQRFANQIVSLTVDPTTLQLTENGRLDLASSEHSNSHKTFSGDYIKDDYALIVTRPSTGDMVYWRLHAPDGQAPTLTELNRSLNVSATRQGRLVRAHDTDLVFVHQYYRSNSLSTAYFDFVTYDDGAGTLSVTSQSLSTVNHSGPYHNCFAALREEGEYGVALYVQHAGTTYEVVQYYLPSANVASVVTTTVISNSGSNYYLSMVEAGASTHILIPASSSSSNLKHAIARRSGVTRMLDLNAGYSSVLMDNLFIGFRDQYLSARFRSSSGSWKHLAVGESTFTMTSDGTPFCSIGFNNPRNCRWVEALNAYVYVGYGLYLIDKDLNVIASGAFQSAYVGESFDPVSDDPSKMLVVARNNLRLDVSNTNLGRSIECIDVPTETSPAVISALWSTVYPTIYTNTSYGSTVFSQGGDNYVIFDMTYSATTWYLTVGLGLADASLSSVRSESIGIDHTYQGRDMWAVLRCGPKDYLAVVNSNGTTTPKSYFFQNVTGAQAPSTVSYADIVGGTPNFAIYAYNGERSGIMYGPRLIAHAPNTTSSSAGVVILPLDDTATYLSAGALWGERAIVTTYGESNGAQNIISDGKAWAIEATDATINTKEEIFATGASSAHTSLTASHMRDHTGAFRYYAPIIQAQTIDMTLTYNNGAGEFSVITNEPLAVGEVKTLDVKRIIPPGESLKLKVSNVDTCEAYATVLEID